MARTLKIHNMRNKRKSNKRISKKRDSSKKRVSKKRSVKNLIGGNPESCVKKNGTNFYVKTNKSNANLCVTKGNNNLYTVDKPQKNDRNYTMINVTSNAIKNPKYFKGTFLNDELSPETKIALTILLDTYNEKKQEANINMEQLKQKIYTLIQNHKDNIHVMGYINNIMTEGYPIGKNVIPVYKTRVEHIVGLLIEQEIKPPEIIQKEIKPKTGFLSFITGKKPETKSYTDRPL